MEQNNHSEIENNDDIYCPSCGGCGYVGCCGVRGFLKHHVIGKTNCTQEEMFVDEIINACERDENENEE